MNLSIKTSKEVLKIENKTHIINREVFTKFKTNKISDFKQYVEKYVIYENAIMCYDKDSIVIWDKDRFGTKYDVYPVAVCNLELTDEIKLLIDSMNKEIDEKTFLEFVRKMVPCCPDCLNLYNDIENITLKKIVSMSKSKDSRGNISYEYSIKDEGKSSFNPPKTLKFKVPVFKYVDMVAVFEPLFVFVYKSFGTDESRTIKIIYKLEMFNLDQFVENSCSAVVESQMKQFNEINKFWGELFINYSTDEYRYKDVPMKFDGV